MMTLNDVKLSFNFNLRRPCDARRATPIYCVVRLDHRQMKLPTALKVYPHHWDDRKQECVVSADMSETERNDNMQANREIFALRCKIDEIISYLCSGGVMVNADFMERYIRNKLTISKDMANKNAKPPMRRPTASKLITEAFNKMYPLSSTKSGSYRTDKGCLNSFLKYIEDSHKFDTPDLLTQEGLNDYMDYLMSQKRSAGRINQCCNLIKRLINKKLCFLSEYRYLKLSQVGYAPIKDSRRHDEMQRRPLTDVEIEKVMDCQTLTEKEIQYRDVFTMQLSTGVRFSDLGKLFSRDYIVGEYDGETSYTLMTQKEEITAVVIVEDTITELQEKYENGFLFGNLQEQSYNDALKSIFEKAGLTGIERYYKDEAGHKVLQEGRLCDIFTNHYLRHTFITQKLREGYSPDKLCYMTGHADDEMIRRIYSHLTHEDKARAAIAEAKRVKGQAKQQTATTTPVDVEAVARLAVEKQKATEQLNAERQRNASLEQMLTIEEQRREIEQRKHQHEMTAWATGTTLEEYRQTMAELDEQGDEAEIDI